MSEDIQNENTLQFQRVWMVIKKNWSKILGWGIIGMMIAVIISYVVMTPKYSGTIDLLVNQKKTDSQLEYNSQQADLQAINTYKDVLQKPIVLSKVLKEIKTKDNYTGNMSDLQKSISITNETNSQIVSVTVKDKNAYTAADIANAIGDVFSNKIKKIMKINNVTVVTKAKPNVDPVSPKPKINILIGLFLGVILGMFWFIIRDYFDTTVKSDKFLTESLGLANLGTVGHISNKGSRHVVVVKDANDSELTKRRRV